MDPVMDVPCTWNTQDDNDGIDFIFALEGFFLCDNDQTGIIDLFYGGIGRLGLVS